MRKHYLLLILLGLLEMIFVSAQNLPTIEQIVNKAYEVAYYQGKDGRANVYMFIKDHSGTTRERHFIILRKNEKSEQKYYVYFLRPADVRRMVYMVWKHPDRDDDRWLYLPALDLVKRIAASDRRSSFVGSHFVYEDVSGRNLKEDHHELLNTTQKYFVVKHTPKDISSVEFSHYVMWIDRATYMPVKALYYDKQGKEFREIKALKIKIIDGYFTVIESIAKDLRTGNETRMYFKKVSYNLGIPENIFGEYNLRRPPREWLK